MDEGGAWFNFEASLGSLEVCYLGAPSHTKMEFLEILRMAFDLPLSFWQDILRFFMIFFGGQNPHPLWKSSKKSILCGKASLTNANIENQESKEDITSSFESLFKNLQKIKN